MRLSSSVYPAEPCNPLILFTGRRAPAPERAGRRAQAIRGVKCPLRERFLEGRALEMRPRRALCRTRERDLPRETCVCGRSRREERQKNAYREVGGSFGGKCQRCRVSPNQPSGAG